MIRMASNRFGKLIKVLFIVEFVLIVAIIALALIDNKEATGYAVKDSKNNISFEKNDFKIITKAVCEERDEHIFCHDELFVKCDDKEYMISNSSDSFIECNNIKLNLSEIMVNGSTKFSKEWLDPRRQ